MQLVLAEVFTGRRKHGDMGHMHASTIGLGDNAAILYYVTYFSTKNSRQLLLFFSSRLTCGSSTSCKNTRNVLRPKCCRFGLGTFGISNLDVPPVNLIFMPPNISVVPMFAMPVCFHVHSAILDFRGPVMGSLKSPCTTSYRSSIETIALNCLVFEKIAFFAFWRQTDRQTNR